MSLYGSVVIVSNNAANAVSDSNTNWFIRDVMRAAVTCLQLNVQKHWGGVKRSINVVVIQNSDK